MVDMQEENISGFDFLRGLVRQFIQDSKGTTTKRPTTAVFQRVPRENAPGYYIVSAISVMVM